MTELHYSPSDLKDLYEAPRHFKALLYGIIGYKLEQLEKEAREAEKK